MKKLFILIIAALFTVEINAQTTANFFSSADQKLLKGFDEKAVITELKQKGIPETEFSGILRLRKTNYMLDKKGLHQKLTLSEKSMETGPCINTGFEDTTFANWTGATGFVPPLTTWTPGFVSNGLNALENDPLARHTLLTNTSGFDINAVNIGTGLPEIPLVAPGGSGVSVRLGNDNIGAETEKLDYTITVTPFNTSFNYQYAVVLQNSTANPHTSIQSPRFDIRIFDQFGVQISGPCGAYGINTLDASVDSTFSPFIPPVGATYTDGGYYKKWTTVAVDLTPYIGTTVTIEFQTSDCTLTGHFGYAYIDASCSQLQAQVAFCPNDTVLMLTAPAGFVSYQWYDNSNAIVPAGQGGTNDTLWVSNPVLGQVYTVSMISGGGCGTSLSATLQYSTMSVTSYTSNSSCITVADGMAYVTTTGANPPFTYVWHDALGTIIGTNNDTLPYAFAGTYSISITSAGGCSASDSITIAADTNCWGAGVATINNNVGVVISPNPLTSQTTITSTKYEVQSIKITDVLGNEIRNYELGIKNGKSITIDMSDVAKGIYFVRIEDEKRNVINKKIVIQ